MSDMNVLKYNFCFNFCLEQDKKSIIITTRKVSGRVFLRTVLKLKFNKICYKNQAYISETFFKKRA